MSQIVHEGYGPNEPALRRAKEEGCGYDYGGHRNSAVHGADVAKEIGLDFITYLLLAQSIAGCGGCC